MAQLEHDTFTYMLPSGATIEIENLPERRVGAVDVARREKADKLPLDKVIGPLGEVADLLFETVKTTVKTPSSITLELGASLKGQSNLVIVSGEGSASIKVTLTWDKPDESA